MKQENPFKRLLSGLLASAMALSYIPPQQVEASGSGTGAASEYTNIASAPSTPGQKGTSRNDAYNLITEYQYSIKVSLFWAPRADTWGNEPAVADLYTTYDWSPDKVVHVIDGMYLYETALVNYNEWSDLEYSGQEAAPDYWSNGSGIGYLTSKYAPTKPEAYREVHQEGDDLNEFTYAAKSLVRTTTINTSVPYWYKTTEFWGIDGPVAQNHLAQDSEIPRVFYKLEEWRSRILNMEWDPSRVDANNQLVVEPILIPNPNGTPGEWNAYLGVENASNYDLITHETSGIHLHKNLFNSRSTIDGLNGTGNEDQKYYITDDVERIKSYYWSPTFMNVMHDIYKIARDEELVYANRNLQHIAFVNFDNILKGRLVYANGDVEYGEYKMMIEPVINRLRNYQQTAFSIKDTTMQYITDSSASSGNIGAGYNHQARYESGITDFYQWAQNSFQVSDEEPQLGIPSVQTVIENGEVVPAEGGLAGLQTLENQWGWYIVTFPAVPVEDVDPLPTIIKTYVAIDYDEDGNVQYDSDGNIKYKWAAPSTEAATLSTNNSGGWSSTDTTYVINGSGVTQQPNIHLFEGVIVYGDNGDPIMDPETGGELYQRAYLNDIITTSVNVKSDPEVTEWLEALPTGLTLNGEEETIAYEEGSVTSYTHNLLVDGEQFVGMETSEDFANGLVIVDGYYSNEKA